MIKKLRKKFILLSTTSLLLLLGIIVVSSNFLTYRELVANADKILSMIAANDGRFVHMPKPEQTDSSHTNPTERDTAPPHGRFGANKPMSPEIMYESRFFIARISPEGNITAVNTENILMVDDEAAEAYAILVNSKKGDKGFLGDFRYIKTYSNIDTCIIFLDCGRTLFSFKNALFINCLISFTGLLTIFVFIVIYSKKLVRPVSESYEKQKQFISMAGHEIKTPITIIDADAEILSMEIGEDNEWLQDICAQTKRMAALTNDLLSLSRMDENRQQFHMIDFPLSDVTAETVQSFQTLAKSKGKNICAKITPMLSYHGDESSIRQIIGILLDNAIKYTKDNGNEGSTDIELELEKRNHHIILSVKNCSEPVSDEQLRLFFDRFYRTEQSRNSETGGYGLGLSIAKSIAEMHKGKISACAPTTDTVQVTVTLPVKDMGIIFGR